MPQRRKRGAFGDRFWFRHNSGKKLEKDLTNEGERGIIIHVGRIAETQTATCGSGGTGRRARLRGVWYIPYGFKSRFPHYLKNGMTSVLYFLKQNGAFPWQGKSRLTYKHQFASGLTADLSPSPYFSRVNNLRNISAGTTVNANAAVNTNSSGISGTVRNASPPK